MKGQQSVIAELLGEDHERFTTDWFSAAFNNKGTLRTADESIRQEAKTMIGGLLEGIRENGDPTQFDAAAWSSLRKALSDLSASRAARGATAGETNQYVLAIKKPLLTGLQKKLLQDPQALVEAIWWISSLVDQMAQHTVTAYQRTREEIIQRQQQDLLELSTPVVKLWEGVLAVPMIGTLDSARSQMVMESLLQRIVESGSELAIIDITGVPTVDTLVAQHLIKTVTAIRLMGADCIISGIRPQIAQTIVHLGIDLQGITTKATLADAFALALKKGGYQVTRAKN